jgi:hypothetical protein
MSSAPTTTATFSLTGHYCSTGGRDLFGEHCHFCANCSTCRR